MTEEDSALQLAIELMTASCSSDEEAFVEYAYKRLDEELKEQTDAYHLVSVLAKFAGSAITAWAEDTGREPTAVMQTIALDVASPDD